AGAQPLELLLPGRDFRALLELLQQLLEREGRLGELLRDSLAAHPYLLQDHACLAHRAARLLSCTVRFDPALIELAELRLHLLHAVPGLFELRLHLDAQGELLLEPCPVRRERRLALLELPADLLLALAEVPELRLHAFQALGRRFLAGAAILELDRD